MSLWLTFATLNFLPGVRPNHVSGLMLLVGLLGCYCVLLGSPGFGLVGCFLLYLSFLLDKVDGDIARYRDEYSGYGKFLDEIYHLFPQTLLFMAMGFSVAGASFDKSLIALGLLGTGLAVFNRVSVKLATLIELTRPSRAAGVSFTSSEVGAARRVMNMILLLLTRFDIILVIAAGGFLTDLIFKTFPVFATPVLILLVVAQAALSVPVSIKVRRRLL